MFKKRTIIAGWVLTVLFISGCSKTTEELIRDLRNDNSFTRIEAGITLMGRQGDHDVVLKLIDLLDDEDQRVVFIVTQILGSMADTSAVEPLGRMTKHPDPEFRARACYSLGSIGHETALPYLVEALDDSVAGVRHEAVTGLGYQPHAYASQTAKHIFRMLRDEADSVRAASIHSLYNYRNVKNVGIFAADLAVAVNDPSDLVRYVAVQALGGGFPDTSVAGDILTEKLKDSNKYVRIESITSLRKLRYEKAVPYLKEMYDTATVDEEYEISETIKIIADEIYPPSLEGN